MLPVPFEQQQINTKEREVNALSEVLGSIVARKLLGDNAPKSFFIIDQTYISVASKKIPNLSHSNKNDLLYTDIERVMVLDYLISHGDSDNSGNVVYIEKNGVKHVSLIDYSMAFDTIKYRPNIPIENEWDQYKLKQAIYEAVDINVNDIISELKEEALQFFDRETVFVFSDIATCLLQTHQELLQKELTYLE